MSIIKKSYSPTQVEQKWYEIWSNKKCFTTNQKTSKKTYSIVIPPPNVTGVLHMGHILNNTIQDILARRARLQGKEVLWLPGTDHAGIATQTKVEKQLKEKNIKKEELGREKFIEKVWEWKHKHGDHITKQLRTLGCSCDWSKEKFTMDKELSRWVNFGFTKLFQNNNIYKGKRIVNWCPATLTALSDEEVIMKSSQSKLYFVKYKIHSDSNDLDYITIATTRPETIMGDTAIAVNPNDPRYKKFIGKYAIRPFPEDKIPIIADEKVEKDFGSGALKITPAHDHLDFEIGQKHNIPTIDIMNPDGTINCPECPKIHKLDRKIARKKTVEILKEKNLLVKEEDYLNNIGYSERANVPIEPRLSEQWFLKSPKVNEAIDVVKNDKIIFRPTHWKKTYIHWMTNIKDWCISRQLWWGHRIPIWNKEIKVNNQNTSYLINELKEIELISENSQLDTNYAIKIRNKTSEKYYTLETMEQIHELNKKIINSYNKSKNNNKWEITISCLEGKYSENLEKNGFTRDPDVLDTWFSSWLWPFSTMSEIEYFTTEKDKTNDILGDQINKTELLDNFYPTTDLVTAPDIIFFWVARMIMAGLEFRNKIPFENVFFNSVVRDNIGRKMSKSLGNSPEPIDLIKKYGADGLRFGLMRISPLGLDVHFDEKQIEEGRNFANKLWNAARFRQMFEDKVDLNLKNINNIITESNKENIPAFAIDIIDKLYKFEEKINTAYKNYKFNEVANLLYSFFWNDFCDIYLETTKADIFNDKDKQINEQSSQQQTRKEITIFTIDFFFFRFLPLLHPVMPHISEELWDIFNFSKITDNNNTLTNNNLQNIQKHDPISQLSKNTILQKCEFVDSVINSSKKIRNLKAEYQLANNKKISIIIKNSKHYDLIQKEKFTFLALINCRQLTLNNDFINNDNIPALITEIGEIFMPIDELIDVNKEKERLNKELSKLETELKKSQSKLSNKKFVDKAPKQIIDLEKSRLNKWTELIQETKKQLNNLS